MKENDLIVDTRMRRLVSKATPIIPYTKHYISIISTLDNDVNDYNRIDIILIVNSKERYVPYAQAFSTKQGTRLPVHKPWDHTITLRDTNMKMPNGPIYRMTWEEETKLIYLMQT